MMMKLLKKCSKITALVLALMMICAAGASAEAGTAFFSADDLFSSRDLKQEADRTGAVSYTVSDGEDIHITEEGVYVLSGTASGVTVYVEAAKDAKVQIVLDGVSVTNTDFPVIYAKQADKVFVTVSGDSSLSVTGEFRKDGDSKTNAVILSKCDLVLNGTASLSVSSSANGIVGKDELKITGGTITVTADGKAIDANDAIQIADGVLTLTAGKDALHAENSSDDNLGDIYIGGGKITIKAGDDGIHATSVVQIDDGEILIDAAEGIEGTYIQINGGTINIQSSDDGINATKKSGAYTPTVEINDGTISIAMSRGDTDGVDSNGDIIVNGGTISVTGNSTFDYDGTAQFNGGTIIANGEEVTEIPNQFMGGWGGQNSGWGNPGGQNNQNGGWGGREGRGGR